MFRKLNPWYIVLLKIIKTNLEQDKLVVNEFSKYGKGKAIRLLHVVAKLGKVFVAWAYLGKSSPPAVTKAL